ncbi:MAG: hypothetical protein AAGF93_10765 [Cyanobacteria bacterium P01_H01_bin.105]
MDDHQRLADLKDLLELLYEKLGEFEKDLIINANQSAKFEMKQRIKREVLPDIRRYETEYWNLYPSESIIVSSQDAETHLSQIEKAVWDIEHIPSTKYPEALMPLLKEIRDLLDEDDKSASAKLKVALPLIPSIASYELEMNTEKVMYQVWKSLIRLIRK